MKKVVIAIVISFGMVVPAGYAGDPAVKLGRGIANIVGSPLELANGMIHGIEEHPVAGLVSGTIYGVFGTANRILVGAYETATFLIPIPPRYEPILDPPLPRYQR